MTKFRIAIQEVNPKHKHVHNIMFEARTEDIEEVIKRIRASIQPEIQTREELLMQYVMERNKTGIAKIIEETDEDLIDWKAKGNDISKEEYLENEIWHEVNDE